MNRLSGQIDLYDKRNECTHHCGCATGVTAIKRCYKHGDTHHKQLVCKCGKYCDWECLRCESEYVSFNSMTDNYLH